VSPETATTADSWSKTTRSDWKELLAAAASIATLGSVLIYGLLALGYSEFYRELGLTPRDVGVEVGKTVGDAVGLAIVLIVASSLAAAIVEAVGQLAGWIKPLNRFVRRWKWSRRAAERLDRHSRLRRFTALFVAASVVWFVTTAIVLRSVANTRADDVKKGRPVEPVRAGLALLGFSPLEVLAVHADPIVAIASLRDGGDVPAKLREAQVRGRLFYIGRSSGSAVLYDAGKQHHFVVPATSLVFELSNCETKLNVGEECERD
jgi:hypothetical protein